MRSWGLSLLALLLCASGVHAQINSKYSLPAGESAGSSDVIVSSAPPNREFLVASSASAADAALPEPPQEVYGVFPTSDFEVSGGYAFVRFNEVHGISEKANGAYVSAVYYLKDWIGAEGEVTAAFGTLSGASSHFVLGGGGARLRWTTPHSFSLWGHGLVGGSNLSPRTPFGDTTAFAYEVGGGVDIAARRHWAYRIEGDAVGTLFFSTYQISPKVSVGIVYKF